MKHLIIINEQPYGSEKPYNAIRLAIQIQKDFPGEEVRIFLMADAAACAIKGQKTTGGFYNIERMLKLVMNNGAKVRICTSCADARGIKTESIMEGTTMSTMSELTAWYMDSDKITSF
jgi:uncharacterized protein involved in oxidation of intracellular sulfur